MMVTNTVENKEHELQARIRLRSPQGLQAGLRKQARKGGAGVEGLGIRAWGYSIYTDTYIPTAMHACIHMYLQHTLTQVATPFGSWCRV